MINTFTMSKFQADDFFEGINYESIVDTIKGVYTSDGSMNIILDFERVLDESDLYAFRNWELGELVAGPINKRYTVACVFMYPEKLMPNPKGATRLANVGCNIKFKKTKIKVPVEIKDPDDYKPGTHYPRMTQRIVWLVYIEMPKDLMNDIREGSIDLAGQTIDLEELDSAYDDDLDKESSQAGEEQANSQAAAMSQDMGGLPPMGAPMPGLGGI
jgi:hypothetical protein